MDGSRVRRFVREVRELLSGPFVRQVEPVADGMLLVLERPQADRRLELGLVAASGAGWTYLLQHGARRRLYDEIASVLPDFVSPLAALEWRDGAATPLDALRAWIVRPAIGHPGFDRLVSSRVVDVAPRGLDRVLRLEVEMPGPLGGRQRGVLHCELFDRSGNVVLLGPEKEAFEKFMKYPSGKEYEKGMHQALQTFRAMYFRRKYKEQNEGVVDEPFGKPEKEKSGNIKVVRIDADGKKRTAKYYFNKGMTDWWRKGYEAYHNAGQKKPWQSVKEDTSIQDLKKAKKRIKDAWWNNEGDSTKNLKNINKAISKKELDEQKKDKFTQELGQRGATGSWGTPHDKVSTILKPGAAETVRSWAQRAATPEYIGTTATTSAVSAVTGVSTLPLMPKGDEMRRKPKSQETILRVLDKIVKDN